MADEHTSALRTLVAHNPGQATLDEYRLLDSVLRARVPCSLLIFGLGRDSEHWRAINDGGRTAFLEHHDDWIRRGGDAEVHRVRYWTRRCFWPLLRHRPERLRMRLPDAVAQTRWNVIFVDAPSGTRWHRPGRMQSVYTAAQLARRSLDSPVDVFVHDCHRAVEAECCDRFLGPEHLVAQVGSMRHYRFG